MNIGEILIWESSNLLLLIPAVIGLLVLTRWLKGRTGALEVFGHSTPSLSQAFVHHDPGNLQPKQFRQRFHADGKPAKLKALDLHD